ncbi:MAG: hypothetical protein IIC59_05595, partial [Proteobacteria bacterium]|nr:hypothetical protein [Pseudomonadota bacterium]
MQRLIGSVTVVALIAVAYVTTNEAQEVVLPDYAAQLADLPSPPNDRSLPEVSPDRPVGAYGFSRYVYQRQGDPHRGAGGPPGPLPAARAGVLLCKA